MKNAPTPQPMLGKTFLCLPFKRLGGFTLAMLTENSRWCLPSIGYCDLYCCTGALPNHLLMESPSGNKTSFRLSGLGQKHMGEHNAKSKAPSTPLLMLR